MASSSTAAPGSAAATAPAVPPGPRPPGPDFRSAFRDLARGWGQRELWLQLGWQDIRQRYRRSVLGPIWITISMAVTAIALGILYSALFGLELATLLPHVLVGMIVWTFIAGCISEGSEVFVANSGLITHLPAPISIHVFRLVWRQTLFFAHNLIVYGVMLLVFPQPLWWTDLSIFVAFALLVVNGMWVALLVGIVSTRFRDLPPVIQSVVQLLFFLTPIVWMYDVLLSNPAVAERARWVEVNPLFHFVELVRRPLLGQDQEWRTWFIVSGIAVVGWALTLLVMRRYRGRVAYWV